MVTEKELSEIGVFEFEAYKDSLDLGDILIGNGFSINLCDRLNYDSLCGLFNKSASNEIKEIFKGFNTTNFEKILEALTNTEKVNEILKKDNSEIRKLKSELKTGLISTIQQTHPKASEIRDTMLRSLAKELEPFKDIYTTNYDVFLYKIILANNFLVELGREQFELYNDGFYEHVSAGKLGFDDFDYTPRNLIYLHGALFFFAPNGATIKLKKIDESVEYINLIKQHLDFDEFPVYVSEGTSNDKWEAINNNYYLRSAYNRLKNRTDENLVVYGFSFSKTDDHIAEAINSSKTKKIIISIRPRASLKEIEKELSRLRLKFPKIEVLFYNSDTLFSFGNPIHMY